MTSSKDHTDISTTNIITPTMEALPANDLISCKEEKVMRQLVERRDKEKEEVLQQLKEWHEKAIEKYLSYFMLDHHQKIIYQGEIDMTSLLRPP
jgi:hypothetical protein